MKELPIIFCGDMVRAIQEDRKTQTRRIIKPQPTKIISDWSHNTEVGDVVIYRGIPCKIQESRGRNKRDSGELTPVKIKPKYQVGDRLWVKETLFIGQNEESVFYKSDNTHWYPQCHSERVWLSKKQINSTVSSRFMPKWASRIWLEVTGVRVERLQDISEEDAIQEGLTEFFWDEECAKYPHIAKEIKAGKRWWNHVIMKRGRKSGVWDCPIKAFRELWNDINAKRGYPWQLNPWVTVNTFKMIK